MDNLRAITGNFTAVGIGASKLQGQIHMSFTGTGEPVGTRRGVRQCHQSAAAASDGRPPATFLSRRPGPLRSWRFDGRPCGGRASRPRVGVCSEPNAPGALSSSLCWEKRQQKVPHASHTV
eukprot:gene13626-biopygen14110